MAREGYLKEKCGLRAKTFEHHCLKTSLRSLRFEIAPFANLGDLDEIFQLDISDWHSTFRKS